MKKEEVVGTLLLFSATYFFQSTVQMKKRDDAHCWERKTGSYLLHLGYCQDSGVLFTYPTFRTFPPPPPTLCWSVGCPVPSPSSTQGSWPLVFLHNGLKGSCTAAVVAADVHGEGVWAQNAGCVWNVGVFTVLWTAVGVSPHIEWETEEPEEGKKRPKAGHSRRNLEEN